MVCKSINLIPEAPIAEMTALAVLAETLGFDRCWVYDEGLATRDLYVTLTAIALSTDTMEIGPGITNPYTRHPAQTAAAIASLDEVSQGRAFLGIGAGGSLTLDPLGLPRPSPLTAVRETIEASRSLWAGGPVDFDGAHLRLRSARLDHARSDIEIWLAGRGPKMLTLGGAAADGVMLDFIHRPNVFFAQQLKNFGRRASRRLVKAAFTIQIRPAKVRSKIRAAQLDFCPLNFEPCWVRH